MHAETADLKGEERNSYELVPEANVHLQKMTKRLIQSPAVKSSFSVALQLQNVVAAHQTTHRQHSDIV